MKLEDYKKLIIETSKYYQFAKINLNLDNFLKENKNNKICFLRHDIDFCPENALNIALLENKHNIVSNIQYWYQVNTIMHLQKKIEIY